MNMKYTFPQMLITLVLIGISFPLFSQEPCGFDYEHAKLMQNPNYATKHSSSEAKIAQIISSGAVSQNKAGGTVYTIPVVVHVMHLAGEAVGVGSNISDAQINSAIDRLTEYYRGNDALSPIDFEVEFALAEQDENCAVTDGINRIDMTGNATYAADGVDFEASSGVYAPVVGMDPDVLRALSVWDETQYFNIWVVSEIEGNDGGSGIQGYANFYYGNALEGSVMMASVFGYDPGNGNGWNLNSNGEGGTVVHEIGHYLHLYHTFTGDVDNTVCPADLTIGTDSDGCADTEPHKLRYDCMTDSINDCTGLTFNDNAARNYMSYHSCKEKLTADQKTRIRAQLEGNMASMIQSRGDEAPTTTPAIAAATCTPISTQAFAAFGVFGLELNGFTVESAGAVTDNNPNGYLDNSGNCAQYFSIDATVPNSMNVEVGFHTLQHQIGVWIDWNNDGDFDDTNEEQVVSSGHDSSDVVNVPIIYPAVLPSDSSVRIRVISEYDGQPTVTSCGNLRYGQAEDYKLYIQSSVTVPVASFTSLNDSVCIDSTMSFTDTSTESPTSWAWTFTGGTPGTSTDQNPTGISYAAAGDYDVQLIATNANGSDTITSVAYMTAYSCALPVASFTSLNDSVCIGGATMDFTDTSTDSPTSWLWTFTGGTPGTSTAQNPTGITYAVAGNYDVQLIATNANGSDTITSVAYMEAYLCTPPVASFTSLNDSVCTGGATMDFTDTSTESPTSWLWTFTGGTPGTSTAQNPTGITYAAAGDYDVQLIATNADGSDTITSVASMTAYSCAPPVAAFTSSVTQSCVGFIDFTDLSTGNPTSWKWTFSPGGSFGVPGTDTLQNPVGISYFVAGLWDVKLKVTNEFGSDSITISNYIDIISCGDNTWSGNTDTDWGTATNWQGLVVPSPGDTIIIPSGKINYPVLDMDRTIGGLEFYGGTFDLNGFELTVEGDWDNQDGILKDTTIGSVKFAGTSVQAITGDQTFHDVEVDNSAGVNITSGADSISGVMTLTSGTFTTNNSLTIVSDESGTGSIATIQSGADITGDVEVQRYINIGQTNWHLFSSPISGSVLSDWNDDFETSGIPGSLYPLFPYTGTPWASVYEYDETVLDHLDSGFVAPTAMSNVMGAGSGYMVWCGDTITGTNPFTIDMAGSINKGDISMPVTYSNSGDSARDGWNLVGNPYPSTIDWDHTDWVKTGISDAVYVYDPDLQQFAEYVSGASNNGGSQYIASSQGFWVQTVSAAPVLTAKEGVKSNVDSTFFKQGNLPFRINVLKGSYTDQTTLRIGSGATMNFDSQYDAYKMYSTSANVPSICTISKDAGELSINSINSNSGGSIPVKITAVTSGLAQLSFENLSGLSDFNCVYLEDKQSGTFVDVLTSSGYTFYLYDTTSTARFVLHLERLVADFTAVDTVDLGVNNGAFSPSNTSVNVSQYFWDFGDNTTSTAQNPVHHYTQAGLYNVKLEVGGLQSCVESQVRQVEVVSSGVTSVNELSLNGLTVYPNPVKIGEHLQFSFEATSDYTISIVDVLGKVVLEDRVNKKNQSVLVDSNFDTGIYFVKLYDATNTQVKTIKLIVSE